MAIFTQFKLIKSHSNSNSIWKLNNKTLEDKNVRDRILEVNPNLFSNWDELKYTWRNILIWNKQRYNNPTNKLSKIAKDIERLSTILKDFSDANNIRDIIIKK